MSFDLKITHRDLVIGSDGDVQQVTDTDKLVQDILKMALTEIGSNPFFPWYGSPLGASSIGHVLDYQMIASINQDQLATSLQTLQTLQAQQVKAGQQMSAAEQLAAVKSIQITRSISDPRSYRVQIVALSKALTDVGTSFDVFL